MLQKKIRQSFKIFLLFFLFLLCIELGLAARDFLKLTFSTRVSSEQIKVLVISDSVFGDENDPTSLFSKLKAKLQSKLDTKPNKKIVFMNGSRAANSSMQANQNIDSMLQNFQPNLTLVLLGNSDFIRFHNDSLTAYAISSSFLRSYLYRSHVFNYLVYLTNEISNQLNLGLPRNAEKKKKRWLDYEISAEKLDDLAQKFKDKKLDCIGYTELSVRLGEDQNQIMAESKKCLELLTDPKLKSVGYSNLAGAYRKAKNLTEADKYFKMAVENNPKNVKNLGDYSWFHYENKSCEKYLLYFHMLSELRPPMNRSLMVAKECYVQLNDQENGVHFFKKLSESYPEIRQLSLLISKSMTLKTDITEYESFEPNRDLYISKLYFYKTHGQKNEANILYKNRDYYSQVEYEEVDKKNYQELLKKIIAQGSNVIAMQYPNQSNWVVQDAIGPLSDSVQFVSLGDFIEQLTDSYSVIDLFEDDFMHLNALGAELISEKLSDQILSKYK